MKIKPTINIEQLEDGEPTDILRPQLRKLFKEGQCEFTVDYLVSENLTIQMELLKYKGFKNIPQKIEVTLKYYGMKFCTVTFRTATSHNKFIISSLVNDSLISLGKYLPLVILLEHEINRVNPAGVGF